MTEHVKMTIGTVPVLVEYDDGRPVGMSFWNDDAHYISTADAIPMPDDLSACIIDKNAEKMRRAYLDYKVDEEKRMDENYEEERA
jgi:hypothetical protein